MKLCIVGVGAIGGLIGARLATTGAVTVTALARGENYKALQQHGWRLQQEDKFIQCPALVADNASDIGVQDVVILALKTHALPSIAPSLAPLLGKHTLVVSAMNGIPWWFMHDNEVTTGKPIQSVNPDGLISKLIPYQNTIGAVVHLSASRPEPGLVQHRMGNDIILGDAAGGKSQRTQKLADLLTKAGFNTTHSDNIRKDIWYKLWGNMTMNPVSAITGATADKILADPLVRQFCSAVMLEAANIGKLINCPINEDPESRHQLTAKLGAFKTSMLQDVEASRDIELDSIVTAVCELGQRLNVDIPNIETLLGLTRLFAQTRGLYPIQS